MFRSFIIVFLVIAVLAIVGISLYLAPDNMRGCDDAPSNKAGCQVADAVVTISGGNTHVRTAEAIRLYKAGWSDELIFSGAAADTSGPSNAEAMRKQAVAAGVPPSSISIESDAKTTKQNAENVKQLLETSGAKKIILVTSPYHQRRASLEFSTIASSGIVIVNHPASNDPDWTMGWWLTPRGWWLAGGELAKIVAFYMGETR